MAGVVISQSTKSAEAVISQSTKNRVSEGAVISQIQSTKPGGLQNQRRLKIHKVQNIGVSTRPVIAQFTKYKFGGG